MSDIYSLKVLKTLVENIPSLHDRMDLSVAFKLYDHHKLQYTTDKVKKRYCFGDGAYCVQQATNSYKFPNPREIILEGMRITCMTHVIYNNVLASKALSDHINNYILNCSEDPNPYECGKILYNYFTNRLEVRQLKALQTCMNEVEVIQAHPENHNRQLDTIKTQGMLYGNYDSVPTLFVNHFLVKGTLTPLTTVSAICDALDDPPESCTTLENEILTLTQNKTLLPGETYYPSNTGISVVNYLLIFLLIVGFAILAIYLAKRMFSRVLFRDIEGEVDSTIKSYSRVNQAEGTNRGRLEIMDESVVGGEGRRGMRPVEPVQHTTSENTDESKTGQNKSEVELSF